MGDGLAVKPGKAKTIAMDAAVEKRAERAVRKVEEVLGWFAERGSNHDVLPAVRRFPARAAVHREWPLWVSETLREVYAAKGMPVRLMRLQVRRYMGRNFGPPVVDWRI